MRYIHFNDGWFCKHLDKAEEALPVSVPDDAMLREPRTATSMGRLNVSWFEGADYSYAPSSVTEQEALHLL